MPTPNPATRGVIICAVALLGLLVAPSFAAAEGTRVTGDTPGVDIAAPAAPASTTSTAQGASVRVVVDAVLSLSLEADDDAFTLASDGGAGSNDSIGYVVTTNNAAGYSVSIASTGTVLTSADPANPDVIPFAAITAHGADGPVPLGNSGATIYDQTGRSAAAGDEHKATFSADIPFVDAGSYTGTVTFTATAN